MSRGVNYKETWDFEILLIVLRCQLENEKENGSVDNTLLRTAVFILIASTGK